MEAYKQSSPDDSECKIKFQKAFAKILDDVQSVIDSPHTRKEKRERILALCENAQDIMKDILEKHKDNKVIAGLPQSGKNRFFSKSVKSQGILFLACHQVCEKVSLLAKEISVVSESIYKGSVFCNFITVFSTKGFTLGWSVKIGFSSLKSQGKV